MTASAPLASIVVPAYNAAATIAETLESLLAQTFFDFELIVVDDGSTDATAAVVARFGDHRIRLIRQTNRGLAGAHNTGIAYARGRYIGFCDADDLWVPEKLERHIAHLDANPDVGISFAGSQMIDRQGRQLAVRQSPKLRNITPADVFTRNPIGNGSAAVIRREALDGFAYRSDADSDRDWWFDETFRQSDDIEGWMRFALTQDWRIEGIEGHLTLYRVHVGGLSANVEAQLETWLRMRDKMAEIAPEIVARHGRAATAYQLRYLARRCISLRDGSNALKLTLRSMRASWRPFVEEPVKSMVTLGVALLMAATGASSSQWVERRLVSTARA